MRETNAGTKGIGTPGPASRTSISSTPLILDDEAAWGPFLATVNALVGVLSHVAPGARGELLTTAQMAERLGIAPKTLLKHKSKGAVRPALQRGKLSIRAVNPCRVYSASSILRTRPQENARGDGSEGESTP